MFAFSSREKKNERKIEYRYLPSTNRVLSCSHDKVPNWPSVVVFFLSSSLSLLFCLKHLFNCCFLLCGKNFSENIDIEK